MTQILTGPIALGLTTVHDPDTDRHTAGIEMQREGAAFACVYRDFDTGEPLLNAKTGIRQETVVDVWAVMSNIDRLVVCMAAGMTPREAMEWGGDVNARLDRTVTAEKED